MSNYQQLAARTMSDQFHGGPLAVVSILTFLEDTARTCAHLDILKKAMFYGKSLSPTYNASGYETDLDAILHRLHPDRKVAIDILHCVIGVATEAGELIDAVTRAMRDQTNNGVDRVNLLEELGDVQWYVANLCSAAGANLHDVQQTNIAKLAKRYPDKFDSQQAIQRDLLAERTVLDEGAQRV